MLPVFTEFKGGASPMNSAKPRLTIEQVSSTVGPSVSDGEGGGEPL